MRKSLGKVVARARCRAYTCRLQALGMHAKIQMPNCTLADLADVCVSGVRCKVAISFNNEDFVILGVFGSQCSRAQVSGMYYLVVSK